MKNNFRDFSFPRAAECSQAWEKVIRRPKVPLLALIVIAFIYLYLRAWDLHLDQGDTGRVRMHAIPVAIAALYDGLPHDYTSRKSLAVPFQDVSRPVNEKIDRALLWKPAVTDEVYYWAADDRGMADFVIGAFAVFGPKIASLFDFYFLVLFSSCLAFLLAYHRRPEMLGLLVFSLLGMATFVSILPLVNESQLALATTVSVLPAVGIFEPRALDVLTMVAVLHIVLFPSKSDHADWRSGLALLWQVCVFFFCYHARSSLGWQFVAMLGILVLTCVLVWRRSRKPGVAHSEAAKPSSKLHAALPIVILLMGWSALYGYKHATYNPRYFSDMGSRTIWHNALMGLKYDDYLGKKYNVTIDDALVVDAVVNFAKVQLKVDLPANWNRTEILNSLGGHGEFDWKKYESFARKLYFHVVIRHPFRIAVLYLVKKPIALLKIVFSAAHTPRNKALADYRDAFALYFNPFSGALFAIALIPLFLLFNCLVEDKDILWRVGALLVFSVIPGVAFYPVLLTMGGTFVLLAVISYLLIPTMLNLLWKKYLLAP